MATTETEMQQIQAREAACRGAVTRAVAALLPGKRKAFGGRDKGYWLAIGRTTAGAYVLELAAPTMEHHDEDPESVSCQCPWSCTSHRHHTSTVETAQQAIDLSTSTYTEILSGRIPAQVSAAVRS